MGSASGPKRQCSWRRRRTSPRIRRWLRRGDRRSPDSDSGASAEKLTEGEKELDHTINTSSELKEVIGAFEKFWKVDVGYADKHQKPGTAASVSPWDLPTLRAIHAQLKRLPREHARNKVWEELLREPGAGGSMDNKGNFTFGESATAWTQLSQPAHKGDQGISVRATDNFSSGDTIAIKGRPSPDTHKITQIDTPRGETKLTQDAKAGAYDASGAAPRGPQARNHEAADSAPCDPPGATPAPARGDVGFLGLY